MRNETAHPLPDSIRMPCYACETLLATHLCRYKVGELSIQVCLCEECMKLDTTSLLKNTIGIQAITDPPPSNYRVEREVLKWPRRT